MAIIFALLIVVFLLFSAFAVDLGAAWAQRREAQTAADAGAMAGILSPEGDIVGDAMAFVEANVSSVAPLAWDSCPSPDPVFASYTDDGGNPLNFTLADPSLTTCVWVSTGETEENATYVAVRTPNLPINTALARVVGIDTIDVDAFAISRIVQRGDSAVLPFVIPFNAPSHVCLGSPPAGLARNPCSGGTSGSYGYIASPTHGNTDMGTPKSCEGEGGNAHDILSMNIALGTDHPLVIDDDGDTDPSADADNPDTCDGNSPPTWIPDSINSNTGNQADDMQDGLISNMTFGDHNGPSRLQLPQSLPGGPLAVPATRTVLDSKGGNLPLDNVALWEYIQSGSGSCDPSLSVWADGGQLATEALEQCLLDVDNPSAPIPATVTFSSALLSSPRFAVIPQMWRTFPPGGSAFRAIKQFRAVYLQGMWFNCAASAGSCMSFEDLDGNPQEIFFPGEGDADACPGNNCKDPDLQGLTALLLPIDADPSGVIDLGPDSDERGEAELVR